MCKPIYPAHYEVGAQKTFLCIVYLNMIIRVSGKRQVWKRCCNSLNHVSGNQLSDNGYSVCVLTLGTLLSRWSDFKWLYKSICWPSDQISLSSRCTHTNLWAVIMGNHTLQHNTCGILATWPDLNYKFYQNSRIFVIVYLPVCQQSF